MPLYLDYNATSPVLPEVLDEMIHVYREHYGNASSRTHLYGQDADQVVSDARRAVAKLLNVESDEVVFTSGATESDNLAILGLARWGAEEGRRHIVSTGIEHKAVLEPLAYLSGRGFEVDLVPSDESGRVKASDVLSRVRQDTLLVTVMHANNETGIIQPVDEIGRALKNSPTYFHTDAAQTYGKLVDDVRSLDYDLLSLSGHKVFAPQGIGALVVRRRHHDRVPVQPITFGGGHESGLRPGTSPVALIAGLGKASRIADNNWRRWAQHADSLREQALGQLREVAFQLNGDQAFAMRHCLNVSFPGVDSEALMVATKYEMAISNGSACTSHEYGQSHVLVSMGLPADRIAQSVRISWGPQVTQIDLRPLIRVISDLQLS